MGRCNYWGWRQECQGQGLDRASVEANSQELKAKSLLTHRVEAQSVFAGEVDLTGDQAVVVDTTSHGVAGAGVDDVLEDSILVNEAVGAIGCKMVADDHADVVHRGQNASVPGAREIDGGEGPVLPEEAVADEAAGVGSDYVAVVIDTQRVGCQRIGIGDGGVVAVHELESHGHGLAGAKAADRVSQQVDVEQPAIDGLGMVDGGEVATLQQESVNVFGVRAVLVETGTDAGGVAPVQPRG